MKLEQSLSGIYTQTRCAARTSVGIEEIFREYERPYTVIRLLKYGRFVHEVYNM